MFELKKVSFNVTNGCNLRCEHCFASSGVPLERELTFKEISGFLRDLYGLGVFELEFSGGEPFVRPDFLDILKLADSMDFSLEILTNGTLIDDKIVKILENLSVRTIQISIEGLKKTHETLRGGGTFDRTLMAIKLLKDAGMHVQARTTITKNSLSDIEALADLLVEMDVDAFLASEFIPIGRGLGKNDLVLGFEEKEILQNILNRVRIKHSSNLLIRGDAYSGFEENEDIKRYGESKRSILCGALRGDWCAISPNGIVTPCDIIHFYAGNLRLQRIGDIWRTSPVINAFRNFNQGLLTGSCGACESRVICGGCRALAFLYYGNFYGEDPMCWKASKSPLRSSIPPTLIEA
jgi:radical SAM protein with 4Fe4S-binding SPASM domain